MKPMRTVILLGRRCAAAVMLSAAALASAEDIDIFLANSGVQTGEKPNVMILLDNSANWSRAGQGWGTINQGQAEMRALRSLLNGENIKKANVGLAGYTGSGQTVGGYVRFGIRDMAADENRTALSGILGYMDGQTNAAGEKVNDPGETAAMYEVSRYFAGAPVYRGVWTTGGKDPANNVDKNLNGGDPAASKPTAYSRNLTSGFAVDASNRYTPPAGALTCGNNVLVMIINNAQGRIPAGSEEHNGVKAGPKLTVEGSDDSWTDEWAVRLFEQGIRVYVIDVWNTQNNLSHSKILRNAALVGGGKYYNAKSQADIEKFLDEIFIEINATNSTFSGAALPISATNRSQYANQVFIGMFRPGRDGEPRWPGNLKRYQLKKNDGGTVYLADSLGASAVDPVTGFVGACAASYWTTGSGSYWNNVIGATASTCPALPAGGGVFSDLPDGATVERGGAAEVLRKGNNPVGPDASNTNVSPTWSVNRTLLTAASGAISNFTRPSGWSETLYNWVRGLDDNQQVDGLPKYSEFLQPASPARTRPSIHGDVIHSRPLPVDYGGSTGVVIYYGANDGMFRAVQAETGKELWSFIEPSHLDRFARLKENSPPVQYPGWNPSTLEPRPKDYFFDGSSGLYQNAQNATERSIWIYPSLRRGGRMLYGFDVSTPGSPLLKWRIGCPNLGNDDNCVAAADSKPVTGIGQTWSQPMVAFLKGYSQTTPVLIVGAGYDKCDDQDTKTPSCDSGRKGAAIYVIDAFSGAILESYATPGGSVAADVALADRNGDGSVDVAYAVTTGGDVYRVDFSSATNVPLGRADWTHKRIAYTAGGGRKFQQAPALMPAGGNKMYVAFGSGDREKPLSVNYPTTQAVVNRFYTLLDSREAAEVNLDDTTKMRDFSVAADSTCTTEGVMPASTTYSGWFMDLPGRGEQTVTSALIVGGMVTFSTNVPATSATNTCSAAASLGEARGYWVNLLNASGAVRAGAASCGGARYGVFTGGGFPPSPTLAPVLIDGKVETVVIGPVQRSGGASSVIAPQAIKPPIKAKRRTVYWKSNIAD